jgi:polysaccharide pyruvyl transferase WcaK-like protein
VKVMLLNDNANVSHVGCLGVSDAHARMLGRRGHRVTHRYLIGAMQRFSDANSDTGVARALADPSFREALDAVDAVVVNGEGTIHHGAGTEYLNVLGAAVTVGKPALLVNSVLEAVEGFDHILAGLDDLTVRDTRSKLYLASKGIRSRLVFDSFIEAGFRDDPIVDLSGRVVVTDWHHSRDEDVGASLVGFLQRRPPHKTWFLPFLCRDVSQAWAVIPAMLSRADVVVTGRHHGIYSAILAGVPFVAFSSNTHKVDGLIDAFPELAFCLNPTSIAYAIAQALERREAYDAVREVMLRSRPLSTFDLLGGEIDPDGEVREVEKLASDCRLNASAFALELPYRLRRRSEEMCMAASYLCG